MAFEKYSPSGILAYALPLYLSPVLAGASAAPWTALPVFALCFSGVILWTRRMPQEPGAMAIVAVGTLVLNICVTGLLFAVGRVIAIGLPLNLPLWAPLALCAAAATVGCWRYRWTPRTDQLDKELDDALVQLTEILPHDSDPSEK